MSSEVAWAVKRVHRKTGETQWYTGCGQWTNGWHHRFLDDLRPVFGLQEFKRWRPTHRLVRVTVTRVVKPKRIVFEVGDKVTINDLRITGSWLVLADACGGVQGLATALCTTPSTVWRWGTGKVVMGRPARIMVAAFARSKRVPSPVDVTLPAASRPREGR